MAVEAAVAVAVVEPVVASSAECARHVHPPSYHSLKGGDVQHVQDDQHVQLVRQEGGGPSVGRDAGADVGAGAENLTTNTNLILSQRERESCLPRVAC